MKIKNNTKNLIPRKLIGGLIPKFKEPADGIRRLGVYKGRSYGVDGKGRIVLFDKEQRKWNVFSKNPENLKWNGNRLLYDYFKTNLKTSGSFGSKTNSYISDTSYLDEIDELRTRRHKPTTQNPGTQGSGTRGGSKNGTRGKKGNARTTATPITTSSVTSTNNVPNGMEYASDYLKASTPDTISSTYNTLALNVLSDVDKRIAEIRPTISSRSAYADMEDAMAGWDLKRKLKMMDASIGTAWDWNTEEGRKNFVGMANLMKNGKGNYNKIYDQWIASQPKSTESQNETYAQRFPLAYQSGLLTTPITDNLSLTTQLPTNQPSIGWVNTLAILDAVNRTIPQLSIGNTNNNNFATLELPQNLSGFVTDLFKRKRTGDWTFAKQGTKLIRRRK